MIRPIDPEDIGVYSLTKSTRTSYRGIQFILSLPLHTITIAKQKEVPVFIIGE